MNGPNYDIYRFDCFEVRVKAGVLLRKGQRVRIQELPFRMLLALLENPGKIVSREELRQRLWNQQSFGELDNGLHVAAAKLREALGETASNPRFIRTVPREGYQFIGSVSSILDQPEECLTEAESSASPSPKAVAGASAHSRKKIALAWLSAFLLASAVIAGCVLAYERRPIATSQDRLVLGSFINRTGDHAYDGTLSLPFRVKIGESPYLGVISDQQFRRLIKEPDKATLNDKLHACAQLGAQILVEGQIAANNPNYTVRLTAWRCSSGRQLTTQAVDANLPTDILAALDLATEKLRRRLGEPESSLKKFNVPALQATTGSLAALRAYHQGEENHMQGREFESVADYKLAIDLDPQFALAYARLGTIYRNAEELSLSRQYYQKAFDLRERTTDRERLYITSGYYSYATGEIERAVEAYQLWHTVYPRDIIPVNNLASQYLILGQPEKALELARAAIRLDPAVELPYAVLAEAYHRTSDDSSLAQLCNDPVHGKTESIGFHLPCFQIALAKNDEAEMRRQFQLSAGNPQRGILLWAKAEAEFYHGRLQESHRTFSAARQSALDGGLNEFAAEIGLNEAFLVASIGRVSLARQEALSQLQLVPSSAVAEAGAAYIFACSGDIPRAQDEAAKAFAQSPKDTLLNSAMLAEVRAQIQLERHNPEAAVQSLEETRPYDLNDFTDLMPAYLRGLSYLDGRHWQQAAKEFQHVLDHRAISPNSPYISLAQLELGRAMQLAGDQASAQRSYRQAALTWKDADSDYPPLQQLRAYQRELGDGSLGLPRP